MGEIAAGMPIEAVENIIDYEEIDEQMASSGEHFALQIKGESMAPRFVTGDVVIVKKQPDIETGQIGIVLVNGENATVKKINKTDKGIMLIPSNPQYEAMFYSIEDILSLPVTIIGRVVELRAKF
jgi:repressor LexA